ncbi:class I SAM-dependent methyltransferase [Picosynechococcus sp. NKBG15041c]|uniref:class I SAM-dependent methyltransferase n=1 Tax=Picosynechococcus sp. NKBG15041c TaxID=1407650 RepID=UPI0004643CAC|nr:class I SAM-dependent methyltransferase [Picosynechococcus sp. NKBG15041c]
MTASPSIPPVDFRSKLVNGILAIRPIATFAKNRARAMMIQRAEKLGVPWRQNVETLQRRDWRGELAAVENPALSYPSYYLTSFHAYDEGNLGWEPALEVESAAYSVHSTLFGEPNIEGDALLRESYHQILKFNIDLSPQKILDIGCSVGMSTEALKKTFPEAELTGVDLSPYFLAVAKYRTAAQGENFTWCHAPGEDTQLPAQSFDLVSCSLIFHELPQTAAIALFQEAKRLLKPGGYFAMMDMNPQAEVYKKMPPYILTLLKSTEPYLDQYFSLDVATELQWAGFEAPFIQENTPRHRTVIAKVQA